MRSHEVTTPSSGRNDIRPTFSSEQVDQLLTRRLYSSLRRQRIDAIRLQRLENGGFTYVAKRSNVPPFYGSGAEIEGMCWASRCPTPVPSSGILLVSAKGVRFQATRDIQLISGATTSSEATLMYEAGIAVAFEVISAMHVLR